MTPRRIDFLPCNKRTAMLRAISSAIVFYLAGVLAAQAEDWVVYQGKTGPGQGKHIVFLAGDEEYRSEEGGPGQC